MALSFLLASIFILQDSQTYVGELLDQSEILMASAPEEMLFSAEHIGLMIHWEEEDHSP